MKRALLLALVLGLGACKAEAPPLERCAPANAGTPVDSLLLAFLSRARAAHHLADDQEAAGDLRAAVQPLQNLVAGPLPNSSTGELAPEVREVLADTRARLADLRSRLGLFDLALADVHAGLEHAREPNYFQGHLLETEGLVEERHAKAQETSDPTAAAATRKRAIVLLEQAMAVQSQVIQAGPAAAAAASATPPAASAKPNGAHFQ